MPSVWAQRPQTQVQLVGKDPPSVLCKLAHNDQRVQVTGFVPDMRYYLRAASSAIAPLTYGAGIQNKVLEAMACSTPVVANLQAVSALNTIDGRDVLIGNNADELAGAVLRLLEDDDLRTQIGRNGRVYVEKNHDWNTITRQLEHIYRM